MAANPNPGTNVFTAWGGPNKYGAAPPTANRAQPVDANNAFVSQDYTGRAAGTPNAANDQTSPLALTGATTVQTIAIPQNATAIVLIGSAAFNFSEYWSGSGALVQYVAWPSGVPTPPIDVARQQFLYVEGTGNLSFYFPTL